MLWDKGIYSVANKSKTSYDFGKLADIYDNWYGSAVGQMYDRLEKKTLDSLVGSHNNGKQLLDIGCGTGHWSRYFSEKGFEVVKAKVPLAEMNKYSTALSSISGGRAMYFMKFSDYVQVPSDVQDAVIKAYEAEQDEE